jgi:hypothetical protein
VIAIYGQDVVAKHARPEESSARLDRILDYFGEKTLADLNQKACEAYVEKRGHAPAARRELEDLRAAVRHHWRQGLCSSLCPVVLPDKSPSRERWLHVRRRRGSCGAPGA